MSMVTIFAVARLALAVSGVCAVIVPAVDCTQAPESDNQDPTAKFRAARERMVDDQIAARGVTDPRVLAVMRAVPRHRFVPPEYAAAAYSDHALPIGFRQTISQPYIVAYMTEALRVGPGHRVLEIGTGSGYQAAVLAEIAREVYTIEIVPELADRSRLLLRELRYTNVHVLAGDGYAGLPEQAPFDRIIATAAPDHVPQPLLQQLAIGGRMILPVGGWRQQLMVLTRDARGIRSEATLDVMFVPLTRKPKP
jgi:protein-L-isoaspartate(D-aspartate) O-methyltransferase